MEEILRFFPITIGLHQRHDLNPYHFALVMNKLAKYIQVEAGWFILFAHITIVGETEERVNTKNEI